jgi:hypothetical protein
MPQVQQGDTASGIAAKAGLSPAEFLKLNPSFAAKGNSGDYQGLSGLIKPGQAYVLAGTNESAAGGNNMGGTSVNGGSVNVGNTGGQGIDLHGAINGAQDGEIGKIAGSEVPTRGASSGMIDAYSSIKDLLTGGLPTKPASTTFSSTYDTLRGKYGLDTLETSLNDLTSQEANLQAQKRESIQTEYGKPVALNVIQGRIGEQERQFNEQIDTVQRQKEHVSNQIKNAYSAIDTVMKYQSLDYNAAKDAYDTQFTQNIQLLNAVKGFSDTQHDNAVANLNIIYNSIKDGGLSIADIPEAQKNNITKLELQAGLPAGFYQYLQSKNPKSDVLTTYTGEEGGKKLAYVLLRDPKTGAITVSHYQIGSAGGTKAQTYSFTPDNKTKLVGLGLSLQDINGLQEAIAQYGLEATLGEGSGLTSEQTDEIKLMFGQ